MEKIIDWLEARLDESEAAEMARQAERDPETAAKAKWIRTLMNTTPGFQLTDPPLALRPALERLFDTPGRKPGLLRQLMASLAFDSWGAEPAPGMRATGLAGETRQMLFSSDLLDISTTLRPHAGGDHFDLLGQILPLAGVDPGVCSVELLDEDECARLAESDEDGHFAFRDLPDGEYRLTVAGPGFEITMPTVKWRS